jgi:REP element-mobilizing transposase RayT
VEILEGSVSYDHVHLLLSIPPKMAVSRVVGRIKGRVAIRMYKETPEIRKKFWGRRFELPRYCRRLHFLRGWGHDKTRQIFTRVRERMKRPMS